MENKTDDEKSSSKLLTRKGRGMSMEYEKIATVQG